jgi:oxygen-independent coproporphyrinogen-3 oxidase
MSLPGFLRRQIKRRLIKGQSLVLRNETPSLEERLQSVDSIGLYLHIPFCRQICPYCPYNKTIYRREVARRYAEAVKAEIDLYAPLVGNRPVTSLYIGGGTPTTMLCSGLDGILEHLFAVFNMQCGVHMESHPNDLSRDNLRSISSLGVDHLSVGVEALQDHHLRTLRRPYSAEGVMAAIGRAVGNGFRCVNVDLMFALPGQTTAEVAAAGRMLVDAGVDQIAAYPMFRFPYTEMGSSNGSGNHCIRNILSRRRMLAILEGIFYGAGFQRSSVWAFTRPGVSRYCSVTVPLYIGLGASGGSYLRDVFYLNTFNVTEYIKRLEERTLPIALSLDLTAEMQMAGWLYWRIYETRFRKSEFDRRFGVAFDEVYGRIMRGLALLGFLQETEDEIILTDTGTYWLHVLQDLFSLDYVSLLWSTSQRVPWPETVTL